MVKRFGEFGTAQRHPLIRELKTYIGEVQERPERYHRQILIGFRKRFVELFNRMAEESMDERNRAYFPNGNVPRVFSALLERYKNIWTQQMDRVFATAIDSIEGATGGREASRLARVTNIARALIGLEPIRTEFQGVQAIVRLTRNMKRVFKMGMIPYMQMLLNTVPRNMIREYEELRGKFFIHGDTLFLVRPHAIENSADTCRFISEKVLTAEALALAKDRTKLRTPLFHPNCRHDVTPIRAEKYNGPVVTVRDLLREVRSGRIKRR